MKKLLSILTISTLTASIPIPLLANTTLTRVKRDVGVTKKDITDGMQIQMSNIKDLSELNWTNLITNRNKRNVNSQNKHTFKTNGNINPRAKQIKNRIKILNPQLDITKINVTKITENSATIISNDNNIYSGKKNISFKVIKNINNEIPNNIIIYWKKSLIGFGSNNYMSYNDIKNSLLQKLGSTIKYKIPRNKVNVTIISNTTAHIKIKYTQKWNYCLYYANKTITIQNFIS